MTRHRRRWERDAEADEKAIKAGKPRAVLRAAIRESKKEKVAREAYEAERKEIAETAARNEAMWAAMPPHDAPSDPDP